ncbi:type I toxin-antitoxin system toxin TisB [Escherichia coli]|nr:type I toxin-antitoxin system toxin TisB [Escherichia coli]HDQ6549699.1 type I toxin-antitoxin system toxin TisB [Escherichia coli O76:H7]EEZ3981063.1 type I toxin-antitoxin system toxin TisB [Escherichia coli]EFG1426401.1 type I toxin-antitoxin system toxin TisB [Escherichia coli]EFH7561125.1 type I toxin-antitoxin system toxin TisB [Escherichia coli]EFU0353737.1 type I toxin-antitoxin system toxin TisB [Escherichia coli]
MSLVDIAILILTALQLLDAVLKYLK